MSVRLGGGGGGGGGKDFRKDPEVISFYFTQTNHKQMLVILKFKNVAQTIHRQIYHTDLNEGRGQGFFLAIFHKIRKN